MQKKQFLTLGTLAIILFSSCSGNNSKSSDSTPSSDTTQSAATSTTKTNDAPVKANINVTLTGGDYNGSYSTVCKEGCCSWGIAGENTFGNQYSETGKGPKELSSVQLIVNDVKEGSKSTKEFTLTVGFGELFSETGKTFTIDTREGRTKGSGTLDLQYSGDRATVTIKGVSQEGPAIDLKMECNKVMNPNNLGQ